MKRIYFLAFFLIWASVIPVHSQSKEDIRVKSIRRLSKDKDGKSFVRIELEASNPGGFDVGGLYHCLYIGNLKGISEYSFISTDSPDNYKRFFSVAEEDWKKLKNGDPMVLGWGCYDKLEQPDVDNKKSERMKASAFAFLNKKMLRKQPKQSKK